MNDKINVMYAGFWLRFFAYIIDITIIAAVTAGLLRPIFAIFSLPISTASLSLYGISGLVMFLLYFILMTKITNGQTLGKRIIGLRVISLDEEVISWKTIIFREGVCRYFLQAVPLGALYVVAAFTGKKQGIGDLLCDTFVVKDEVYELVRSLNYSIVEESSDDSNYVNPVSAMYSSEKVVGNTLTDATDNNTVDSTYSSAGVDNYSREISAGYGSNSIVVECTVDENVIESENKENDTRDNSTEEGSDKEI